MTHSTIKLDSTETNFCPYIQPVNALDELLSNIHIEFITKSISQKAFELMKKFRASHGVEINDLLIVAASTNPEAKMILKIRSIINFYPTLTFLSIY